MGLLGVADDPAFAMVDQDATWDMGTLRQRGYKWRAGGDRSSWLTLEDDGWSDNTFGSKARGAALDPQKAIGPLNPLIKEFQRLRL